jgi:hypothetical protein
MKLIAGLMAAALIFTSSESESARAAANDGGTDRGSLLEIASKLFPGLTRAGRALLEFADVKNVGRGDYAAAGTTTANYESETYVALPDDPSNDPKDADKWDSQRQIRASHPMDVRGSGRHSADRSAGDKGPWREDRRKAESGGGEGALRDDSAEMFDS